ATDIGNKLRHDGWKGLFGIDVVMDEKSGKLYLIEINARQPASTSYESSLQIPNNKYQITSFEAHIMALLDQNLSEFELTKIRDGAQVVQRVTKAIPSLPEPKLYKQENFKYIKYNNTKPEADLLRMQTPHSIMESHGKLNEEGQRLLGFITAVSHDNVFSAPRASVFIVQDNKILLMKRHRYVMDYYTIIGGTVEVEQNESLENTALREGKEETGLEFELEDGEPIYLQTSGRDEYYYFAKNISGTAHLQGPELEHSVPDNSYELVWVDFDDLKDINLLPEEIKEMLIKKYKTTI
ncbi:NUDIX domain-containing protein, partial [Patescibacteria group bacterium]|nr:NUDIX domain-containing protein [Patescibacteria group bacterium]